MEIPRVSCVTKQGDESCVVLDFKDQADNCGFRPLNFPFFYDCDYLRRVVS